MVHGSARHPLDQVQQIAHILEDWDSLEQINLLTAIEKKFSIKFKLADVRNLKDVGDLLDLVKRMAG